MKLGQQMRLAPRVIQSMEILQLPLMALQERIEQELESNIALEQVEPGESDTNVSDSGVLDDLELDVGDVEHDFARLESYESSNPEASENEYSAARVRERIENGSPTRINTGERDGKMEAMANTAARGASPEEQLSRQWGLVDCDDHIRALGSLLIANLDADGYIHTPLEEIAAEASAEFQPLTADELLTALAVLQRSVDPPGVGARDTGECLLLQIEAIERENPEENWSLEREIIEDCFEDLLQNRLPRITEKTGESMERVNEAIGNMRRLDPAPARSLVIESPQAVVPDAIIEYDEEDDRYIAYLNDRVLPNLRINKAYARMVRNDETDAKTREFLRTNLSNAEWLLDAVEQRKRTLLRVLNVVSMAQRDFFDQGSQAMRPLPMTHVADQLGVHVATVSRAVSGKHVQTPRGVFPLRRFFTGGLQTDGGEDLSWDAIKAALQEIVDAEDKTSPLSDDALAEALKQRGIDIARRTVAKYRSQLNIPSARMRKHFV
jgi:RNA polymerase sigma-54 factor